MNSVNSVYTSIRHWPTITSEVTQLSCIILLIYVSNEEDVRLVKCKASNFNNYTIKTDFCEVKHGNTRFCTHPIRISVNQIKKLE